MSSSRRTPPRNVAYALRRAFCASREYSDWSTCDVRTLPHSLKPLHDTRVEGAGIAAAATGRTQAPLSVGTLKRKCHLCLRDGPKRSLGGAVNAWHAWIGWTTVI